tara:strand:- start:308 stop:958 length:651 start_codon:yes stop_codon:yes gene_type:complete
MKNLLISIFAISLLIGCNNKSTTAPEKSVVRIHQGKFAFCGASSAVPTGRKITIQGVEFDEGCAICPVLDGSSISNLAMYGEGGTWGNFNVKNSFETPDGTNNTVWSLFWYFDTTTVIPQFNPQTKSWEMMTPKNRSFIIDMTNPATSESNMFAMPGIIIDTTETGIILAKVYGPLNEDALPLRIAIPVKNGETSITAAKKGAPYPVGTPIPTGGK